MFLNIFCYDFKQNEKSGENMDHIDRKIIELLQEDGRMTIIELFKQLNLSRPSVNERIRKLEDNGVIEGFTARISSEAVGKHLSAFIQICNIKLSCTNFEDLLNEETDITECHKVTGAMSYMVKVDVVSKKDLERLVDRLSQYAHLNVSLILSSPISNKAILPSEADLKV